MSLLTKHVSVRRLGDARSWHTCEDRACARLASGLAPTPLQSGRAVLRTQHTRSACPEIQGLSGFSPKPTAGMCPSQQRRGPGDPRVLVCDSLGRWAGKTAREPCGEPGSPGDSPPKARESPLRSGHSRDGAFRANQAEGKSILKDT